MIGRLYVEGGGDSKALRTECRRAFSQFVRKAGIAGRLPRIIACGGRQNAYDSFRTALSQAAKNGNPLLLVDAEQAVTVEEPWEHLQLGDGWSRPPGARSDQCHLMVECMEAWFLADQAALAEYYGHGFHHASLPRNPQVEQVPKADILHGIKRATRGTQKGQYSKGKHSFAILADIDPARLEEAAPWAARFLAAMRAGE